jgi:SpoVK/Ycf46/Vps4 family AAA+-type ATPase
MTQVRQNFTEYAALTLGSKVVRAKTWQFCGTNEMKAPRSILLYGARGTGKTMLAEALAYETDAMLFNLSPANVEGKFTEKGGAAKLLHMVFTVAKEPALGPSVIYIDEVEKMLLTSKKKTISEGPGRFKKDLPTYLNTLAAEDAVFLVGCTREPWGGDEKAMRGVFDKMLYIPYPKYGSLVSLWTHLLNQALRPVGAVLPDDFDVSSLAHISIGYTAGSIVQAVKSTLTERRLERLDRRPLEEGEFVPALSRTPRTYRDDNDKFRAFTDKVTGLEGIRKQVRAAISGEPAGKGKKGKGKGKKGK